MKEQTKQLNGIFNAMKKWQIYVASLAMMITLSACNDDDAPVSGPTPTKNDAKLVLDKDKLAMIYSLRDLEGNKGRIYEMDYTVDYKLAEALEAGITKVVFDRNGYLYHGRVKEVADGARNGGLKF